MAPRKKQVAASPMKKAGEKPMYQVEYDALVKHLESIGVRRAFVRYLNARRLGSAETILSPKVETLAHVEQIRGKAYAFMELLAMCEEAERRAKSRNDNEGA